MLGLDETKKAHEQHLDAALLMGIISISCYKDTDFISIYAINI